MAVAPPVVIFLAFRVAAGPTHGVKILEEAGLFLIFEIFYTFVVATVLGIGFSLLKKRKLATIFFLLTPVQLLLGVILWLL